MHILFLFSIILTAVSSSFLTLIFENKNFYTAICGFGGIFFAQIVFTYELLSLFSAAAPPFVLLLNLIIFVIATILWKKYGQKPAFSDFLLEEKRKIKFAIQKDKLLKLSLIAFSIFIAGSIMYIFIMPVIDGDALSYHVARLPFWYDMKSINHFVCSDVRALIMPINSEVFYFWAYSFIKSDIFVRVFSFLSYLLFVAGLRGLFLELKISAKTSLWTILAVTAMQNVMFAVTGTETNIAIAALMILSVYLFLIGARGMTKKYLFIASLLYALAVGTKTPALQAFPMFFLVLSVIAFLQHKKNFYKPILIFGAFAALNFILFASYNYVLNFIDFGNPLSSWHNIEVHRFDGGIKGFFANIIRYIGMMIDTSGLPYSVELWRIKVSLINILLACFNISPDLSVILPDTQYFKVGNNFENMCGLGILGLIVFLPAVYFAAKRIKHSAKSCILGVLALGFIINLIILSLSLGYMFFSIRFVMFYVLLSSPVIAYIFIKNRNNGFKKFLAVFIMYSLTVSYFFYERRFYPYLLSNVFKYKSLKAFKDKNLCCNIDFDIPSQACEIITDIKNAGQKAKVLYFASEGTNIFYPKHSENDNLHVDFKLLETTKENDIDWDKYDYIVIPNVQQSTNIKDINYYRNAVIAYNDGSDGSAAYYDYSPELFSNCIFLSSRQDNIKWLTSDDKLLTGSECFYKRDILEKHGFRFVKRVQFFNMKYDYKKELNLFKKTMK
ncbi:MAG: hypothetical protein K6C94_00370 [Candidatus Gastranaerophilales bacterium]|nr:hypothetical protein [Candidatus Gastranaerophilales bacterium]